MSKAMMRVREEWQVRVADEPAEIHVFPDETTAVGFASTLPGPRLQRNGVVRGAITITKVMRYSYPKVKP